MIGNLTGKLLAGALITLLVSLPCTSSAQLVNGPEVTTRPASTELRLDQLIGKIDPAKEREFAPIPATIASRPGMYANRDALAAFLTMRQAAKKDGVELKIVSAFRSFADQKRIWETKWRARSAISSSNARSLDILKYSAMPGASRHHWGTDFDFNSVEPGYFSKGAGAKAYAWLVTHAPGFGFCQTYTAVRPARPTGYQEEKWHWSYLPVANRYLTAYTSTVSDATFTGFDGAETARDLRIVENYVRGIDTACRP